MSPSFHRLAARNRLSDRTPRHGLVIALAMLAILVLSGSTLPPGATPFHLLGVPSDGGTPVRIQGWEREGVVYVSVNDLSRFLGLEYYWRSDLGQLTLSFGSQGLTVTEGSEIAALGDKLIHLPGPVMMWNNNMQVPLEVIVDEFGQARSWTTQKINYYPRERRLAAKRERGNSLRDIRIMQDPQGWKLVLRASGRFRHQVLSTSQQSFVLRLRNVNFDPVMFTLPPDHAWFQGLRLRNVPDALEISFSAAPSTVGYTVTASRSEPTLEVLLGIDERDLREGNLEEFSGRGAGPAQEITRIVLDPSHGGRGQRTHIDEGARSFAVCEELAATLQIDFGIDVVLTREKGDNPNAENRLNRANRARADLFLSLHVPEREGGPAAFVASIPQASAEVPNELRNLGFQPTVGVQEDALNQSRLLARSILESVATELKLSPMGLYEEAIPELQGAVVPAAILEIGVTKTKLSRKEARKMARGIIEGLKLFVVMGEEEQP